MTSGVVLLEHQQANPGERTAVVLMLCDKHTNASLPYPKATGFKPAIHQTLTRLWLRLTACGVTACTWCLSSYARPDPTKTLCRRHDPAWRRRQANFPRPEDTSVCLPPAPAVRQTDLTGPPTPTPTPTTRPARLQSTSRATACLPASLGFQAQTGAALERAPWRQPNGARQQRRWAPADAAVPSRYPLPCSPPFLAPARLANLSTASRDRCPKWTTAPGHGVHPTRCS